MFEILAVELKSDLERIYKISGDMLNQIEKTGKEKIDMEIGGLFYDLRSGLMDIGGTLQKDIYNCDYIMTRLRTEKQDTL